MRSEVAARMGIGKKIVLLAACFSLPMAVLAWQVIISINENVTFGRLELMGNLYQDPLEALLHDFQEHQRLVHYCPNKGDCSQPIAALKASIDKDLSDLQVVDQKYGRDLQFTTEGLTRLGRQDNDLSHLQTGWQAITAAIAQAGGKAPAEIDSKYDLVIAMVQTMIAQSGDTSNLILDPELDTYHFITDTLVLYPQTLERLGRMIGAGRQAIGDGVTAQERSDLMVQAALLEQADRDQIKSNLDTALKSADNKFHKTLPSFQENLPPAYKDYEDSVNKFAGVTRSLASGGKISVDDYTAAGLKAREASYRIWVVSLPEVNKMLELRIAYYGRWKVLAFFLSGIALLLACFIAYRVAASVINPLNRLALTLGPGATLLSNSVDQLNEANSGGVYDAPTNAVICDELTAHAGDMRKTANELEAIVFGSANAYAAAR